MISFKSMKGEERCREIQSLEYHVKNENVMSLRTQITSKIYSVNTCISYISRKRHLEWIYQIQISTIIFEFSVFFTFSYKAN